MSWEEDGSVVDVERGEQRAAAWVAVEVDGEPRRAALRWSFGQVEVVEVLPAPAEYEGGGS